MPTSAGSITRSAADLAAARCATLLISPDDIRTCAIDGVLRRPLAATALLAGVQYYAGAAGASWTHDDLVAYFAFAEKILATGTLIELVHNQRSLRLEWYIIVLIALELLLSIYGLVSGNFRS